MGASMAWLTDDEIAFYRTEGYLVLQSLFSSAEVAALADDVERVGRERRDLIDANNMRVRFQAHTQTGEALMEVFDPIADLSPTASKVANDRRILDRLHDLYGEPACLFKEKLIWKPPRAIGATLHQDWISWPNFPKSFLTVLLAIDPFDDASGATQVYPRIHTQGYLSSEDGQHHTLEDRKFPVEPVMLNLAPGDVAIFSCFTPHSSKPNHSARSRRGYFLSYNAQSDGGDQYAKHYAEFHDWIRTKYPPEKAQILYFR